MLSGISIWQLLIVLAIVLLLFGSKRLRNLGPDLGSALKGFRSAIKDEDKDKTEDDEDPSIVEHANRDRAESETPDRQRSKTPRD
tara:strand:+ start:63 stop:317 length:255 start_codon:yes stop_codon:yes gene_type:complete